VTTTADELDAIYEQSENKAEMIRLLSEYGNTIEVLDWAIAKRAEMQRKALDEIPEKFIISALRNQ
jgi:hypothetical protein